MRATRDKFWNNGDSAPRFTGDERGSLTIFSLFLFLLLLMIAGMAVDMIRHEHSRVAMQNTLDSAVLAASSLSQDMDPEVVVREYVSKAGMNPNSVTVTSTGIDAGSTATQRSVIATTNVGVSTMFMNLMGVDSLNGPVGTAAAEANGVLEIVLVLDTSNSMNDPSSTFGQTKIQALRTAATEFLTTVFGSVDPSRLMVSIVPYNDQVRLDADFYSRLAVRNITSNITPPSSILGALGSTQSLHPDARCLLFNDADFQTTALSATSTLTPGMQYSDDYFYYTLNGGPEYYVGFDQPNPETFSCGPFYSPVLPFSNNESNLKNHINNLQIEGNTAIHYGMNFAAALLDPTMQSHVSQMILDGVVSTDMTGRPLAYARTDSSKIIVLMTDGANSTLRDLKPEFRSGPTRIWYSPSAANEYDGFYVHMPSNSASQRWFKPGDPNSPFDNTFVADTALPLDAVQWDYHTLYSRFGYQHAAMYFFQGSDFNAYNAHMDAVVEISNATTADTQLDAICDAVKATGSVEIYTIAFEAPANGQTALQNCASSASHYFDVNGTQISTAFDSIATQVTVLKLVR